MRLNVKPDEIGAQQAIHQLALPGADAEGFRVGPGDVPENCHARVRPLFFDQPRQQRKVIVLNQNHGVGSVLDFLQHRRRELLVYILIVPPVGGAKNRTSMRDVAERPQSLVGKTVVVTLFLLFAEPHPAQAVARIVRRNAQSIVCVHNFHVGISAAVGDPGAVAGVEHRLQRRHQAAGRDDHLNRLPVALMHVGFTIGDHKQTAAIQASADLH